MGKGAMFLILLIAACLIAGLYGAVHNQISYTVAPDYFHGHKFRQFGIPEGLQNRLGASLVGWLASWWMGLFIGVPVLLVGLILPEQAYFKACLMGFGVAAGTALAVGLGALVYAFFTVSVAFDRAGVMHGFSYLGGLLGILTAAVYLLVERLRRD